MDVSPRRVIRTYLALQSGNTLASSFIWGINTLFLLNAGLDNFQAFVANAFFTLGMVVFEVPTGIVADSRGRRVSYLLGTVTLSLSTVLYYLLWLVHGPLWAWAAVSILLGLGFTFFSGAVDAWLVDALHTTGYKGKLEKVFGQAQALSGAAMLVGTLSGGALAEVTNLGVPYLARAGILLVMFVIGWRYMHDIGFQPEPGERPLRAMYTLLRKSVDNGLRVAPVKWLMLSGVLASSVGFYAFYALQPYLLELYGDNTAYLVAGLAAALVAVAQMAGGLFASRVAARFKRRSTSLVLFSVASSTLLILLYFTHNFYVALAIVFAWGLCFAATTPIRQTYLNGMILSSERATVLSFDSMLSNGGGIVIQPALARAADVWSYGASFAIGSLVDLVAVPMLLRSRSFEHKADNISDE